MSLLILKGNVIIFQSTSILEIIRSSKLLSLVGLLFKILKLFLSRISKNFLVVFVDLFIWMLESPHKITFLLRTPDKKLSKKLKKQFVISILTAFERYILATVISISSVVMIRFDCINNNFHYFLSTHFPNILNFHL